MFNHHFTPRRRSADPSTRSRRRRAILGAALLGPIVALGISSTAVPARAATPVIKTGDIIVPSHGNIFDGATVDKFDPVTGVRTRVAALFDSVPVVTSDATGNIYAASRKDGIVRIDRVTGAKETITENFDLDPKDMVLGPDGALVIANETFAGTDLVSFNPQTRQRGVVNTSTTFSSDVTGIAVEFDGSILVLDRGRDELIQVQAGTGKASLLTRFSDQSGGNGLVLNQDGDPLVRLQVPSGQQQLVKIGRVSGAQKVLASTTSGLGFSQGMARAADGTIVSAEFDIDETEKQDKIVRFAANGGARTTLATVDFGEVQDVTIAGVPQILPIPLPVAKSDTFSFEPPQTNLHVSAADGPLANDQDPAFNQDLKGESLTQPTHGFVSFLSTGTGEFFWFPPAGFVGTDSFTYRVRTTDGRVSAPATITLKALGDQTPVAKDDNLLTAVGRTLVINAPGVLFNDTDPQGDKLTGRLLTEPTHGTGLLATDGTVSYTANAGFVGEDTLTYEVSDGHGHVSKPATVTFRVPAPPSNNAPSVGAVKGGTLGADGLSGTFNIGVFDFETPANRLLVKAASSNTALVPNANLVLGGSGSTRTLTVKAASGKSGSATITVTVTDAAGKASTFSITVKAGTDNADTITGTDGSDLLLGLGSDDTLLGNNGFDLLSGGAGNDTMTGGPGTDSFRGGAGTNKVTDLNTAVGELKTEA